MAEALAIVGLVAAIVQFIDVGTKVVLRLQEFNSRNKELPAAFQDIFVQLPLLINDLKQTKDDIEARNYDQETRKSVLTVVEGCQAHIKVCHVYHHCLIGSYFQKIPVTVHS